MSTVWKSVGGYVKSRLRTDVLNSKHIKVKSPDAGVLSEAPGTVQHIPYSKALPRFGKCINLVVASSCVYPFPCNNSIHCVETQIALVKLKR